MWAAVTVLQSVSTSHVPGGSRPHDLLSNLSLCCIHVTYLATHPQKLRNVQVLRRSSPSFLWRNPAYNRSGETLPALVKRRTPHTYSRMAREDENAGPTLLVISIVMLVLVLSTTALRVTVRAKRSALGGDDYTIAAASLLTIGRVTCQIISVQHGNGRHREFLSIEDYEYINLLTWCTQHFLFPILCLLKISVCLLVLRIKSTKLLRWGLWSLIVLLILSTALPNIVLLAECRPVSAYWTSQHDKCWNPNVRIYSIYLQTCMSPIVPNTYFDRNTDLQSQPCLSSPTSSARCCPWQSYGT